MSQSGCAACDAACNISCTGPGPAECLDCAHPLVADKADGRIACRSSCASVGKWFDLASKSCKACSSCPIGTKLMAPCTENSDTVCAPCQFGTTFRNIANNTCMSVRACPPGEEPFSPPTATSDRVCKACSANYFKKDAGNVMCKRAAGSCPPSWPVEVSPPNLSTDRVCRPYRTCTETEWAASGLSVSADRECRNLTICSAGFETASQPTATSDRTCTACKPGFFQDQAGQATCRAIRSCGAEEFESKVPTTSSDRTCARAAVCNTTTSWEFQAPTATSDRLCKPKSVCAAGTYIASVATPSSDTVCLPCNQTSFQNLPGQVACRTATQCTASEFEEQPLTATSDRICKALTVCSLAAWESGAPTRTSDRSCTLTTVCLAGFETKNEATKTSDRTCKQCEATHYQDQRGQTSCKLARVCMALEYEERARTPTSNRECKAISSCGAGFREVKPPTLTSDRVCSNTVLNCRDFASADNSTCTRCRSGFSLFSAVYCDPCPRGSLCDGLVSTPCPPGSYQDEKEMSTCKLCGEGMNQPVEGLDFCVPCIGPTFAAVKGLPVCLVIQQGFYGSGSNDTIGFTKETLCEPGFQCVRGVRTKCKAGSIASGGASSCAACGEGRYPTANQGSCRAVPQGYYGVGDVGQYTNIAPCAIGSMCPNATAIPCPPGTYQDAGLQVSCKPCGIGFFSNVTARTSPCNPITSGKQ
jgi:hypothetical protein